MANAEMENPHGVLFCEDEEWSELGIFAPVKCRDSQQHETFCSSVVEPVSNLVIY